MTLCMLFLHLYTNSQVLPEMMKVPGGSFEMGSDSGATNEKPVHLVKIKTFRMSKYLVTVREFAAFVVATGYKTDAETRGISLVYWKDSTEWHYVAGVNWRDDEVGRLRNDTDWNKPVVHVSWNDAVAYCRWLSGDKPGRFRLPAEAEWEYAAGNGARHTTYSWGNDLPSSRQAVANVRDQTSDPEYGKLSNPKLPDYKDGYFFASPVGTFPPNGLGLCDMTGNVWEWCRDWYGESYYAKSEALDPTGPATGWGHVFRGGSWHSKPFRCTTTIRLAGIPETNTPNLGFRVAASI